jgi:hypothetical protein
VFPDRAQFVSEDVGGGPAAGLLALPPPLPLCHQELQQVATAGNTSFKGTLSYGLTQGEIAGISYNYSTNTIF